MTMTLLEMFYDRFDRFDVFDLSQLDEGEGTLAGLPKHFKQLITHTGPLKLAAAAAMGGENSSREITHVKSPAAFHGSVNKALENGHAIVHVNGTPTHIIYNKEKYSGSRTKLGIIDADGGKADIRRSRRREGTGKYDNRRGKFIPTDYIHHQDQYLTKSEVKGKIHQLMQTQHGIDLDNKDHYKNNKIEIHQIGADEKRLAKREERSELRGKPAHSWATPEPSSAALKVAQKHLGPITTPKGHASNLHKLLGDAIANGDTKSANKHLSDLADHIRQHGTSETSYKHDTYASDLIRARNSIRGIKHKAQAAEWTPKHDLDRFRSTRDMYKEK